MKKLFQRACFLGGVLLSLSCGGERDEDEYVIWQHEDRLRVVATTTMLADMVREVGGEEIDLYMMMPAGIDPHSYVQTAKDVAALRSADFIFYHGMNLEGRMQKAFEHQVQEGKALAVAEEVDDGVLIKPRGEYEGYADPHLWGDPELWAELVPVVVEALCELDADAAAGFRARGAMYQQEIVGAAREAHALLSGLQVEERVLVTSHDAFYYFARAFDFQVRGLQGVSTEQQVGLRDVSALEEFITQHGVRTLFGETSTNNKGLRTLAKQLGVSLSEHELYSDSMDAAQTMKSVAGRSYDVGSYTGMMLYNVAAIVEGVESVEADDE